MATLAGFDATTVPEQQEFSAIPEGAYVCIATASEMKPTKNGTGQYLQIVFEVIDGQQKGRKLWARLNLQNQNQTAVDIAQRELGAICRAVGVLRPNDSAELHNRPLVLHVAVELDDKKRQSNVIKKYEAVAGMTPAAAPAFQPAGAPAAAPAFQQQAAAPAAAATPPWQR